MTGVLKIRTTKEFGESTVSKILDLVEKFQFQEIQIWRELYFQIRKIHPAVCYSASLPFAVIPPLCRMLFMHFPRSGATGSVPLPSW